MTKVRPINKKPTMVEPVDHFMGKRIFKMGFGEDTVRTEKDG